MDKEKFRNIIHDTIYTKSLYPNLGNKYVLAANWILSKYYIDDIDIICELAKLIKKNTTYDHQISNFDLDVIVKLSNSLIIQFRRDSNLKDLLDGKI